MAVGQFTDRFVTSTGQEGNADVSSFGLVRGTLRLTGPLGLVIALIFLFTGYPDVSLGIALGIGGGILKSFMMAHSVLNQDGAVGSFLLRYLLIGAVFFVGGWISMPCFAAAAGGLLLVHVVFILYQIKTAETEEV